MTTHLELARIQLNSSGIALGATQGVGTIIELETPYDGNSNPVDVHLVYPASQAIPGQTIVSCYFQSNEGWFIVQGEPGPAGVGSSPWMRFRALNPVGYQRSGVWNVEVTQSNDPRAVVGEQVEIHDPNNLFADVVFSAYQQATNCNAETLYNGGSTGTAYLRTPTTSVNNPYGVTRWEVETCSRSIDKMDVWITECMKASDQGGLWTGTGYIDQVDDWVQSAYPAVDFPPELIDDGDEEQGYCWKVPIENPYRLTALGYSLVRVRRETSKQCSLPRNVTSPHDQGVVSNSEKWIVESVYEDRNENQGQFARFLGLSKGGSFNGYTIVQYWNGQDPSQALPACTPTVDCDLLSGCDCLEDGDRAFAVYNEELHKYEVVATNSALLGPPDEVSIMNSFAGDLGCTFSYAEQIIKAFACGGGPTVGSASLETITQTVVGDAFRMGNDICFNTYDIEVCSSTYVDVECVNLCAECDCDDHVCAYQYTQGVGWELVKACPTEFEDCCCTGEMPTETPSGDDPTYYSFPCGPCPTLCVPCEDCPECDPAEIEFRLEALKGVDTNQQAVEALISTQVWSPGDECCAELSVNFEDHNGNIANRNATVCLHSEAIIEQCQFTNSYELSLAWDVPTVFGITLPTRLGADIYEQCTACYGNNGCGIIPVDSSAGNSWDEVILCVNCCDSVEGGNRDIALESMGVHDVGAGFHNAILKAPPRKREAVAKPQGWGDAFAEENSRLFKGCNCKRDIVPVMNRWERREGEPTDSQITLVATTLYGKQKRGIQSQISVESLSDDIRDFTNRMRSNG